MEKDIENEMSQLVSRVEPTHLTTARLFRHIKRDHSSSSHLLDLRGGVASGGESLDSPISGFHEKAT